MTRAEEILHEKAKKHNLPFGALVAVYSKGIGAWKTNPESVRMQSGEKNYKRSRAGKMSKEQWAQSRVNAFINKKPTVYTGADDHIRREYNLPK